MIFPKSVRILIKKAMENMGLYNNTDLSVLIKGLTPYKDKPLAVAAAMRSYIRMKSPPKSINYLLAIVKNQSIKIQPKLDAMPPMATGYEKVEDE